MYSGRAHEIHYKYSTIQATVLICFIFGPGMPILFIFGFGIMSVMYIVEKWSLARYYRQPPNYSEKMNQDVIDVIAFGPMLYALFGLLFFNN